MNMKYTFLLGGPDLEMKTISEWLTALQKENGFDWQISDMAPSWNEAKLSKHISWFKDLDRVYVGIELQNNLFAELPDRPTPQTLHTGAIQGHTFQYYVIDHHNEYAHLPASIEQLAALLGKTLNRHQQLIAANDRGYKPAMRAMGATEEEVAFVRKLDRQAQGVSEEMEQIAEESLRNSTLKMGVWMVKTPLANFSAIVDRVEQKKMLIYNANSLNYYGPGIPVLAKKFADLIKVQIAYYGGGDSGFFGIAAGALSEPELEQIIQNIISYVAGNSS